jgi:hypothetical protein
MYAYTLLSALCLAAVANAAPTASPVTSANAASLTNADFCLLRDNAGPECYRILPSQKELFLAPPVSKGPIKAIHIFREAIRAHSVQINSKGKIETVDYWKGVTNTNFVSTELTIMRERPVACVSTNGRFDWSNRVCYSRTGYYRNPFNGGNRAQVKSEEIRSMYIQEGYKLETTGRGDNTKWTGAGFFGGLADHQRRRLETFKIVKL